MACKCWATAMRMNIIKKYDNKASFWESVLVYNGIACIFTRTIEEVSFLWWGKKVREKSSWWGLIGSHLWSLHHRHSPFSDKEPINVVNRQKSHLLKWNMSLQWTFLAFNYEIKLEIFVWITRQDILDNEKWISFVTARLWRCRRCCCHFLPFVCHCYCRS